MNFIKRNVQVMNSFGSISIPNRYSYDVEVCAYREDFDSVPDQKYFSNWLRVNEIKFYFSGSANCSEAIVFQTFRIAEIDDAIRFKLRFDKRYTMSDAVLWKLSLD